MPRARTRPLRLSGGADIAIKIPPARFAATVAFYTRVLKLPILTRSSRTVAVQYGPCRLHLDRVPGLRRAEVWLELVTPDLEAAEASLARARVQRCDEVEALPPGFPGFWVQSPVGTVTLVTRSSSPKRSGKAVRKGNVRVRSRG